MARNVRADFITDYVEMSPGGSRPLHLLQLIEAGPSRLYLDCEQIFPGGLTGAQEQVWIRKVLQIVRDCLAELGVEEDASNTTVADRHSRFTDTGSFKAVQKTQSSTIQPHYLLHHNRRVYMHTDVCAVCVCVCVFQCLNVTCVSMW